MRINKFVAFATGMSRRAVDQAIVDKRITVNGLSAVIGQEIDEADSVALDSQPITSEVATQTIMLNKPVGYVCSRAGQGSKTIYELLPPELHSLKPVGRLDKDSSGLLLLTNDGDLAHQLTHPIYQKEKVYEVVLDKPLSKMDKEKVESGVEIGDGLSKLDLSGKGKNWTITMNEGRNRQIRRTFDAVGNTVEKLHRTEFGPYSLDDLPLEKYRIL